MSNGCEIEQTFLCSLSTALLLICFCFFFTELYLAEELRLLPDLKKKIKITEEGWNRFAQIDLHMIDIHV